MNIISSSQQWLPLCEPLSKPKLLKSCIKSCVTFVGHRNFWAAATFILMAGEISPFCHLLSLNFVVKDVGFIVALMVFYIVVD